MKQTIASIIILMSLLVSCKKDDFSYPDSKIWAHRVNDTTMAIEKSKKFIGLEVDAIYSEYQDEIFVGHNIEDTSNGLTLDTWFNAVEKPSEKYFWIDFKNLDSKNADKVADIICSIMESKEMEDNLFVESYDTKALKIVKKHNLRVILWTENLQWNKVDTVTWITDTRRMIEELEPDALSNEDAMYGLLIEHFPEQNIHLWQKTPKTHKEENIKRTHELCRNKSVKAVLVDYDQPLAIENTGK